VASVRIASARASASRDKQRESLDTVTAGKSSPSPVTVSKSGTWRSAPMATRGLHQQRRGGQSMGCSQRRGTLCLFDTGKQRVPQALGVAFSPDGKRLATGFGANALKVWKLAD